MNDPNDFRCEFCLRETNTLYEGWFYTDQKLNPWAEGTASAGLMQIRRGCKTCVNKAIELGLCKAEKV
jgi:hypothetical protein